MGRCLAFYRRWEEEGGENWCEKTPGAVSQINSYIDLVKSIEKLDPELPKDFTIVNISEGAARPIVSIKDPKVKEKVIDKVRDSLKAKKKYKESMVKGDLEPGKITSADVKDIIAEFVPKARIDDHLNRKLPVSKIKHEDLVGAVIVKWEFNNSIIVEKDGKKYDIGFDSYSGKIDIREVA